MTPVLYLDFDGVLNAFASRNAFTRHKDTFGYHRRHTLNGYKVMWSAELVKKMNDLKDAHPYDWAWLTTWTDLAMSMVNPALGTHGDRFVDWDPDFYDVTLPFDVVHERGVRKYAALKADLLLNPRPFVWVDDTATSEYVASDFTGVLDVPHLVVTPVDDFGITRTDFALMTDFMVKHSAV